MSVFTLEAADPSAADMATLIIVGSPLTRVIERPGLAPLVYTPRSVAGRRHMIEPAAASCDGFDRRHVGQRRPAQHDDVDAERARGRDLAVGRLAAAVLGDDRFDPMLVEQRSSRRPR